jgi:hypothetical protein
MKKFMTALMVLSLVLVGVSLAAAAAPPQVPKVADLDGVTLISDQEAQLIRGTGLVNAFGPQLIARNSNQFQTNFNPSATRIQQQIQDRDRTSCPKP